ncbi:MAG: LysR family transcriptional regulator [Streptosporangiales bacterium]|nr:LysR family transcriptional regulator [Streptosporangiales bacterium]
MIEVRRLHVLRELADHGTVAAAARALHLTPSAVSQQLAALGRETGVPLVEQDGRRLKLTEAAYVLLEHAHMIFAELEQAEADLAAYAGGRLSTLRIGAFGTALAGLVAPVARTLRTGSPPVTVHAVEAEERACFTALAAGELDIAISVEFPGAPQPDGPRFHRRPLLTDVLDVALAPDHPLAGRTSVELERFAGADWALGTPGSSCHEVAVAACANVGFTPRAVHHSTDWHAIGALVAAGGVVALVPRLARDRMPASVRLLRVRGTAPARHVFAATRRGAESSPTVADALRLLGELAASVT